MSMPPAGLRSGPASAMNATEMCIGVSGVSAHKNEASCGESGS